jgi:RNA polymerase-binding transcription factor
MEVNFTQDELNQIYEQLKKRYKSLKTFEKENERLEREGLSEEAAPTKFHQADVGTDLGGQEVISDLISLELRQLRNIEDALGRIDAGRYGQCERCRHQVARRRLDQIPEARYCESCQEIIEAQMKAGLRHPHGRRADLRQ